MIKFNAGIYNVKMKQFKNSYRKKTNLSLGFLAYIS